MEPPHRLFAVALPEQQPLLSAAIDEAGLELVAVGSTSPDAALALGRAFDVERVDDLRQGVLREDVDVLWLAAPVHLGPDERKLIARRGVLAITSEPQPALVADLPKDGSDDETISFTPLFRRSPGFLKARNVLDDFGPVLCANVTMLSSPGEGTLFARLFDAVDALDALCGAAESVHAALSGTDAAIPESIAGLRGHMTINARHAESVSACASVSNEAGTWFRELTAVGPNGVLRIDDLDCRWSAEDVGAFGHGGGGDPVSPGTLVGLQIERLLGRLDATTEAPPETARLLALCEAARLSCRTHQVETPRRMLEMLRSP